MTNGSGDTVTAEGSTLCKKDVAISAISPSVGNVLPTKHCSWTFNETGSRSPCMRPRSNPPNFGPIERGEKQTNNID